MTDSIPYLDAAAVARLRPRDAVQGLIDALRAGFDPASATPRSFVSLTHGQYILLPAELGADTGVKIVTVAPGNSERGLPLIQGVYLLFDAETLAPRAMLDGIELTALRTPAVSLAGVRQHLLADEAPLHIVVVGAGLQAVRHVTTTLDVIDGVRPAASITFCVRDAQRADPPRQIDGHATSVVELGTAEAEAALRTAGIVHCTTPARKPLFDSDLLRDDVIVVAVGSHDPDAREVDEKLAARARVIVEDRDTALREAGDVVMAIEAGALQADELVNFAEAAREDPHPAGKPVFFKTVGMGWEDLVVAAGVMDAI